jgi:hypothetical protein
VVAATITDEAITIDAMLRGFTSSSSKWVMDPMNSLARMHALHGDPTTGEKLQR